MRAWNPRWVAYCHATGTTPEEGWARDRNGAAFIVWIQRRWREWETETGHTGSRAMVHEAFDAWLDARIAQIARAA